MDDPIKDYKEWGEKQYPPAKFTADNFPTFFKPHRIFLVIEGAMAGEGRHDSRSSGFSRPLRIAQSAV